MTTPARLTVRILLAAAIFFAGYLANRQSDPATSSASGQQDAKYACPMHPQYNSDRSGTCPVCGMSLVQASPINIGTDSPSIISDPPGTVRVSSERQQLAGVRTDEVRQAAASHVIRVPGRVTVDLQRLYSIVAAADGWIRKLGPNTAGTFVTKNQVLTSYYSQNLLTAQQTFLTTVAVADRQAPSPSNLQRPFDTLRTMGMDDLQIQEIQRTRQHAPEILVHSPVTGYVVSRNISPEQRFDKGAELYSIADIGHVWVLTDIFEKDREFLQPGAMANIDYRGRKFQARMSSALPQFDAQSRTLKTRFELDNSGNTLLPDMFVDVELEVQKPAAVTVPADAVIDSGRRKTVYVERTSGVFEPREVETGWRLGDRVQITSGLEPGERIVVSGNFLIDSESRMKLADVNNPPAAAKAGTAKDLVCGMDVDPGSPGTLNTKLDGKTYYFCAESCKKSFEANPGKYVPSMMAAQDTHGTRHAQ